MNELPPDDFELQLSRLKPAPLPRGLMSRLSEAQPFLRPAPASRPALSVSWIDLLRRAFQWSVPATALVALVLLVWRSNQFENNPSSAAIAESKPGLKADSVEVDRTLVSSFDAIAELPSGEPVRVHCQEWLDEFVLRDESGGTVVQKRVPRFEVVSVQFETY